MIYVLVNSLKIDLTAPEMYFGDVRGNRSVARPSSAIQMLERIHQRRQQQVVGSTITATSVTFGKCNPPVRPHKCCGNNTTGKWACVPKPVLLAVSKGL